MTKKEFKSMVDFHVYRGRGVKINAIFFDWKTDEKTGHSLGYKFMVKTDVRNAGKAELFNEFYKWVMLNVPLPWYIDYKYADSDNKRFKVPISM